ncbi:Polyketide synthase OS=Streptomyces antimycoticus OX=68175 GN=SANT12839_037370 PE=4 SV=1 [Streptomyces antimycoticus]
MRSNPHQALVWGLGRVAALELPERWVVWSTFPRRPTSVRWGAWRVCWPGPVARIRSRCAARVFGRRLTEASGTRMSDGQGWRPSGSVLVTGGTGALGARLARWLVANGAEHVVLTSRRGLEAPGAMGLRMSWRRRVLG